MYEYERKKSANVLPATLEPDATHSAPKDRVESDPYSGMPLPVSIMLANRIMAGFGIEAGELRLRESPEVSKTGALATARGNAVRFAPGMYRPDTREGLELLGHELSHVREQAARGARAPGGRVFKDAGHEAKSDGDGRAFAAGALRNAARVYLGGLDAYRAPVQRQESEESEVTNAPPQRQESEVPNAPPQSTGSDTNPEIPKLSVPHWVTFFESARRETIVIYKDEQKIIKKDQVYLINLTNKSYSSKVDLIQDSGNNYFAFKTQDIVYTISDKMLSRAELERAINETFISIITGHKDILAMGNLDYTDKLFERFSQGSLEAKLAHLKYVTSKSIRDGAYKGTPHYNRGTKDVEMNYENDLENPRGAGATYLHEMGHLIDFNSGPNSGKSGPSSLTDPSFRALLLNDFHNRLRKEAVKLKGSMRNASFSTEPSVILDSASWRDDSTYDAYDELFDKIGKLMKGPIHNAVSDLYSGLSIVPGVQKKGWFGIRTNSYVTMRIEGDYSHSLDYWKKREPNGVFTEAAAHFYEAQFDPGRKATLLDFFPEAFKHFTKMLSNIVKY